MQVFLHLVNLSSSLWQQHISHQRDRYATLGFAYWQYPGAADRLSALKHRVGV